MKTILLQRKLKIGCNFLLFSASKYNTQDKYNQKIQPNNNANIPFCLYNIFWMIALSWKKIQNYHCSKKCIRKSISLFSFWNMHSKDKTSGSLLAVFKSYHHLYQVILVLSQLDRILQHIILIFINTYIFLDLFDVRYR